VQLNTKVVDLTSPMDSNRFQSLFRLSCQSLVVEEAGYVAGFLLGFTDNCEYDSVNYRWFSERLKHFYYVDRVVIAAQYRGRGLGGKLYGQAMHCAKESQLLWIAAEMNCFPANEASLQFHHRQEFREVGIQKLAGDKLVSMQVRSLQS